MGKYDIEWPKYPKETAEESYRSGYARGFHWNQKRDNYRPGGPWVMTPFEGAYQDPAFLARCEQSHINNKEWLRGFDAGLAAQTSKEAEGVI